MSATKVLAKMEELALTLMEVIHANAKMDGQAIIVTKVRLSIYSIAHWPALAGPNGII